MAGVGFRASCTAADLASLVRTVLAGRPAAILAAPARKRDAPALAAAALLGLDLRLVDDAVLASVQHLCPTRSVAARQATGHASIAEACALASGGRLLTPRIASPLATCALAEA